MARQRPGTAAAPLPLLKGVGDFKSGRGLPQYRTLRRFGVAGEFYECVVALKVCAIHMQPTIIAATLHEIMRPR